MKIFNREFWEVVLLVWGVISFIGTLIWYLWRLCVKLKRNQERPVSNYNNDNFARETIKYRFNDIISKINDTVSCETPFLFYKDFQDATVGTCNFNQHIALQTSTVPANADIMSFWMKKFECLTTEKVSDFLTKAPFIDSEYLFYFYVLTKTYDLLSSDEKKQLLHPGYSSGQGRMMQFDPYKSEKLRMLDKDFMNDTEEKKEKKDSGHKSKIKDGLKLICQLDGEMNDSTWKNILCVIQDPLNILHSNLSSNSSDLSQMFWSKFDNVYPHIDESNKFWEEYCKDVGGKTVNIVVDNFGIEFLYDLVLGYYLKKKGAKKIVYHVKHIPMFVSDVVVDDQKVMLDRIETLVENSMADYAQKEIYKTSLAHLKKMVTSEDVEFKPNYLWNMPFSFSEIASFSGKFENKESRKLIDDILSLFIGEDLLIVKGDLNYRRLVGDKLWNPRRKTLRNIKYIKCPLLVIRSYKSSVVMDCSKTDLVFMPKSYGSDWKTEGRVGSILYYKAQSRFRKCRR